MKMLHAPACWLASLALCQTSAFGETLELTASQDTYASNTADDSNVNYGTAAGLGLAQNSRQGDWSQRVYLQFDLSSIPASAVIEMAELSLYLGYHDPAGPTRTYIRRVTQPWREGDGGKHQNSRPGYDREVPVTWDNRPDNDGVNWASLPIEEYSQGGMANQWKAWDVTKLVGAWHRGEHPNHGLAVTMWPERGAHGYVFTSREGAYGGRPKLKIIYNTGDDAKKDPVDSRPAVCRVLADQRLEEPVRAIVEEYRRRTQAAVLVELAPAERLAELVRDDKTDCDAVICLEPKKTKGPVGSLKQATAVAWTHEHPAGNPVWAAALSEHPDAGRLVRFFGGPTGHRLWSERSDLTIVPDMTANAYDWVVQYRVGHTYPMTAERILRECGGIRDGVCIDIGCGTGMLDIELAQRTDLTITGVDIEPGCRPLFEKNVREAGLEDRLKFVLGDAQELPFPDDHADLIVSRGTLIFIPDLVKALREADRVLKPTGVAFLGGRYVYAPREHRMSTDRLREIVGESGIAGAEVTDARGQWVKIVGPQAPAAARQFQGGPDMLARRIVADYYITEGRCLLIHRGDGGLEQALQSGILKTTKLKVTALYPKEDVAAAARERIREAKQDARITCRVGGIHDLPFDEGSFDLVAGVGPVLIWGDRPQAMREIYRVLDEGGVGLVGGRYLYMPAFRKVSSEALRHSAAETGIPSIRVIDDMGQWVEIRKGIKDRGFCD